MHLRYRRVNGDGVNGRGGQKGASLKDFEVDPDAAAGLGRFAGAGGAGDRGGDRTEKVTHGTVSNKGCELVHTKFITTAGLSEHDSFSGGGKTSERLQTPAPQPVFKTRPAADET